MLWFSMRLHTNMLWSSTSTKKNKTPDPFFGTTEIVRSFDAVSYRAFVFRIFLDLVDWLAEPLELKSLDSFVESFSL